MSDLTTSSPRPSPASSRQKGAHQRRPGTTPGVLVNPRAGDHLRGGSDHHWIRGSDPGLPLAGDAVLHLTDYRLELVAAGVSGDLAYTVGYEHVVFSIDGGPVAPLTLRVTHVYRREDGEWKTVHRHADRPPVDQTASAEASNE